MAILLLIFQSIFSINFIKVSLLYLVVTILFMILGMERLDYGLIKIVLFTTLSFFMDMLETSIFRWVIVLISAGLLLG